MWKEAQLLTWMSNTVFRKKYLKYSIYLAVEFQLLWGEERGLNLEGDLF